MIIDRRCRLCDREFSSIKGLRTHVTRAEPLTFAEYVEKFYPRDDKYSGEPLPFNGDVEEYLALDFLNKGNLMRWVDGVAKKSDALEYCLWLVERRARAKKLRFVPSQIELSSIFSVPLTTFDTLLPGGAEEFNQRCAGWGLEKRFDYAGPVLIPYEEDMVVGVDTREQRPLALDCAVRFEKLSVGDYMAMPPHFSNVFVERKSVADFVSTMAKVGRFERELDRARALGSHLVVLVEGSVAGAMSYHPPSHLSVFKGENACGVMRRLMQRHDNVQFLFVPSREEASVATLKILSMGEGVSGMDLQYHWDRGEL